MARLIWITTVPMICGALWGCPSGVPGVPGGGGTSGGELSAQCTGDFGADATAQKFEAFLGAASQFGATATELEGSLLETCQAMASELQIPESELEPTGDEHRLRAACDPVAAKIQSELADLRGSAGLTLTISAQPPRCEVSIDAYAGCAAECEADLEPGSVEVECEGGELVGTCSAECSGECGVEVSGECSGSCEGSCEGGCSGTCQGACDGECSSTGADGECNGTCNGTCHGTCSAGCQGSCEGECYVSGQASCEGSCRGGCSVDYTEPRCTGTATPPQMSAECRASCDARMDASASCEPGRVVVAIEATGDVEERVARLRAAIEGGWGALLHVKARLERVADSGARLASMAENVPGAVSSMGMQAAACASEAVAAVPAATGSISVSVEVSASMSASAG